MYKNKIACAIKHKNVPLVESKDTVFLPFNTEYSIYLKNMADTIAYITVYVNGRDINPGKKIKLDPKCSSTVEKFQDTNHKFVFKEKSIPLQLVRNNQDEDSLIRIEVAFQVKSYVNKGIFDKLEDMHKTNPFHIPSPGIVPTPGINPMSPYCGDRHYHLDGSPEIYSDNITLANGIKENSILNKDLAYVPIMNMAASQLSSSTLGSSLNHTSIEETKSNKIGFTAPGKIKEEKDDVQFYNGCNYEVDEKFSFIIKLEESTEPIITKKKKKICPSCKTKFKEAYFFCHFDGTVLDEVS